MTIPTEAPREALPELDPKRMLGYDAIRYVAGYPESYVKEYAASLLESERQAHAAEIAGLRADAERLDFLDSLNRALNTQYGTTYQWKLVLSPNVVRLMAGRHDKGYIGDIDLHDSDAHGAASCRAAIDQAIARGKT